MNLLNLWYSKKQEQELGSKIGKLESGEIVTYTEMTSKKRPHFDNNFDDFIFLGKGYFIGRKDNQTPIKSDTIEKIEELFELLGLE